MDDLELFCCAVEENEKLLKAVTEATDLDGICKIAQSYGYKITTKELEDYYMQQVSGGALVNSSSTAASISQNVSGDGNNVVNFGDLTIGNSGDSEMVAQAKAYTMCAFANAVADAIRSKYS